MNFKDKKIVITGGGSGIGRELTLALLKKGAKIAVVDIDEAGLKETKKIAGKKSDHVSIHVVNITDKQTVENLPEKIISIHGEIDGLINNAGIIQPFVKVNDLDYKDIEKVMAVNFNGLLYMTKAFLPYLLKRPEAYIANVSSMGGFLPVPGQSIYGASKAAVKLLTEGLYAELKETNVQVSVIFPGATNTNIAKNSGVSASSGETSNKQQQKMKPLAANEAAEIIISGLEKNKFQIFVGKDSKLMNFLYRLSPKFATDYITKKMQSLLSK